MGLTKPNQQLRRDLKAAASALEAAAQDIFRQAKTYNGPEYLEVMKKIGKLHEQVDNLREMADEVKAGRIVRERSE
ncbi:peptidase [Pseudomonas syringae ICMP 11293]|uniref:hypothetical protein n=1 Tax=Pseudomonas syringae TaxID=317 RepID=UPI0007305742|nr:hypothetical protein [Pseudomonas syringae]KTB90876.1 peptidase [Pseudomonas syringae ICMP 11293]